MVARSKFNQAEKVKADYYVNKAKLIIFLSKLEKGYGFFQKLHFLTCSCMFLHPNYLLQLPFQYFQCIEFEKPQATS